MPIRFRCPHCERLLGIARRKAGTQISCPQCTKLLTVPTQEVDAELDEIDVLLNPSAGSSPFPQFEPTFDPPKPNPPPPMPPKPDRPAGGTAVKSSVPSPGSSVAPRPAPLPREPEPFPLPVPQPPRPQQPQRKPGANRETPLLENDVDSLLGLQRPGTTFELDDEPTKRKRPVDGVDALSISDEPGGLHLSPQKATLLALAVIVLLGIAFAAGYLIASNT